MDKRKGHPDFHKRKGGATERKGVVEKIKDNRKSMGLQQRGKWRKTKTEKRETERPVQKKKKPGVNSLLLPVLTHSVLVVGRNKGVPIGPSSAEVGESTSNVSVASSRYSGGGWESLLDVARTLIEEPLRDWPVVEVSERDENEAMVGSGVGMGSGGWGRQTR